ncbi:MAG: glycine betaine ABC transporter substrate-binding protein [Planctomycetota bacterium]
MLVELALACLAARPADVIVVGSKNFPESHLLGEMLTLLLEEHGEVEHRSALGGTLVCWAALTSGEIDVYPEYTGTAWSVILKESAPAGDALTTYSLTRAYSHARFDVEWLAPFGFDNSYALALTSERARELGVRTISDLAPFAARLRAGFSAEFTDRPDGWPGLSAAYGLELVTVRAMEHALAYEAVANGTLDLVDAYSTDGKLVRYGLTVLEDDRGFFPPYQAAPVVRGQLLRERPEVRATLERLASRLDDERMGALNFAVEVEGRGFREVAHEFLVAEGLLTAARPARRDATSRGNSGFVAFFARRWRTTLGLLLEHVRLTVLAVGIGSLIAIPLGVLVARKRWATRLSLGAAGIVQTVPSLALLAFLIAVPGLGLSVRSAVAALTLYALLPLLRNTVSGLASVDDELVDAGRGLGLTEGQLLRHVRLPLATRTIMAGVRTATVLTIGFATLAAFIGAGGLGEPIVTGLYLNDVRLILAGALPAAVFAIVADFALGRLEVALTPRGLRTQAYEQLDRS